MKRINQVFACVIRQYGTGLYRACVRLDRENLVYLGAYQNEAGANEVMTRFLEAARNGPMKTREDIAAFLHAFHPNECSSQRMGLPELGLAA